MFVRCQRLARFNLLSHNEYFADINVRSDYVRAARDCSSLFADSFTSIVE